MVILETGILIGWVAVPIINELIKALRDYAEKKLLLSRKRNKELKEVEEGLGQLKSMVDAERTISIRGDHPDVVRSVLRLKGDGQAAESISDDQARQLPVKSIIALAGTTGRTKPLQAGSKSSILPPVGPFVEQMKSILQKENVESTHPMFQTLLKLQGSVASLVRQQENTMSEEEPAGKAKSIVRTGKSIVRTGKSILPTSTGGGTRESASSLSSAGLRTTGSSSLIPQKNHGATGSSSLIPRNGHPRNGDRRP